MSDYDAEFEELQEMLRHLKENYTQQDYDYAIFWAKDVVCNYIRNYCDSSYKMAGE